MLAINRNSWYTSYIRAKNCNKKEAGLMKKNAIEDISWVVYKMTLHGKADQVNAICEQSEWDAMELARPGYHTLVQANILDESQAERLARGTTGDAKSRR
jgi:hypothetical protein